jgi:hypothetical protein
LEIVVHVSAAKLVDRTVATVAVVSIRCVVRTAVSEDDSSDVRVLEATELHLSGRDVFLEEASIGFDLLAQEALAKGGIESRELGLPLKSPVVLAWSYGCFRKENSDAHVSGSRTVKE